MELFNRSARSYLVWNDDGTIREYDTVSCAHCRKAMARNPNAGGGRAGRTIHQEDDLAHDYRCRAHGYAHICKGCAQELHENGGVCKFDFEAKLSGLERLMQELGRFDKIDRDQALLIALHR